MKLVIERAHSLAAKQLTEGSLLSPGEAYPAATDIPEVSERGVAVNVYYSQVTAEVRPYVVGGQENVWCEGTWEWWPFTANAVGLFDLRVKHGDRALCTEPAQ